jgi:hypothetical protein
MGSKKEDHALFNISGPLFRTFSTKGVRRYHIHLFRLVGAQEIDGRLVRHLAGEPTIIIPAVEDDRHTGMDRKH